ncbi:GNAT family N-acetyltransferase [Natronomonas sp. EA1]|uniref:GNAT family N-acetyltransferase n=1 Tax=Natronomonas sp. EA1 TaxID=3421655 RepID=UPI003EBD3072
MPGPVFLRGEEVTLHPIEEDDLPFLHAKGNHHEVRRLLRNEVPKSLAEYEHEHEENPGGEDGGVWLLICVDDEPVGDIGIFRVDQHDGTASIGCSIAPEYHGKGYATDAARQVVTHAFDALRLHRLSSYVYAENAPSMRVMEKLGFTEEGVLVGEGYVEGERMDVHLFGLLASEWGGA